MLTTRVHCDTCGWNGEGDHMIEPGDCHRIDYIEDKVEMAKPE